MTLILFVFVFVFVSFFVCLFFLRGISSKEHSPLHSGSEESHTRPTQRSSAFPNKSRFLSQENITLSPSRKLFPCNLTPGEVRGLPQIPAESSRKLCLTFFGTRDLQLKLPQHAFHFMTPLTTL